MKLIIAFFILGLAIGCSNKQLRNESGWTLPNDGGTGIVVDWIKVKNDAVDAAITMVNNNSYEIVVPPNSVQCAVDGLGSTFAQSNTRIILGPGERAQGVYIFEFPNSPKNAKVIEFRAQYIFKGVASTQIVSEGRSATWSSSQGSAHVSGNTVSGSSHGISTQKSSVVSYEGMTFKEGDRLPSPKVTLKTK